jgi:hypothetical protein
MPVSTVGGGGDEGHTSQFSRIKQRPPATDLSGPKASADSLTPRSSNLAVATAVDLQLDLSSLAAGPGSALSSGLTTSWHLVRNSRGFCVVWRND